MGKPTECTANNGSPCLACVAWDLSVAHFETKTGSVKEAIESLSELDAHDEYCSVVLRAEERGQANGWPGSDNWDRSECDCTHGVWKSVLLEAAKGL